MISFLTDMVLVAALIVTSWRTGAMYRELRRLRDAESSFGRILEAADASIDRAAHAVIVLKSEGVKTLAGLERRIDEAGEAGDRLAYLVRAADLRAALGAAEDLSSGAGAPPLVPANEDVEARPVSRLASGTPANR